jgi:hypothetical protein
MTNKSPPCSASRLPSWGYEEELLYTRKELEEAQAIIRMLREDVRRLERENVRLSRRYY